MDSGFLLRDMFIVSDLVAHSFDLRSEDFDAESSSELVEWLAQEFMLGRCVWFASAVARVKGREHFVAFMHPDGRLAHAVAAVSPQYSTDLKGDGCDILGRRPLAHMLDQMRSMNADISVVIGQIASEEEFDAGQLDAMTDLAALLPWTARLVGKACGDPEGKTLRSTAIRLGMPDIR